MVKENPTSFIEKNKFILILISIGFLIFLNSFFNGFVWDDEELIVNNVVVHSFSNITSFFIGGAFNSGGTGSLGGVFYKPMMTTIFSLLYTIFGNRPFFFHLFSVIVYIINSILVYILFKEFLISLEVKKRELSAFIVALFFLLHPLYSEVVFYVSNFQDLLFVFFGLTGFLIALKKNTNFKNVFLISILFLCSLLSKETGLIIIIMASFYSFLFKRKESSFIGVSVAGFSSIVLYSLMRFGIAKQYFPTNDLAPIARLDLMERLINLPKILYYYFQNFFVPINLSVNQSWLVKSLNLKEFYLPLAIDLTFLGIILFISYWLWKKKKSLSKLYFFFLTWFFLSLLPHSQIFPLDETATGRWFYLPAIGLLGMLLILSLFYVDKLKDKQKEVFMTIVFLIITIFGIRTFVRSFDWRNGLTFYSKEIKLSGDNFSLENNLGVELYRIGKLDEAYGHWERSTELASYWWTNFNNLGVYYLNTNDFEKAEECFLKSIENGHYYLAYENYALVLLKQKKYDQARMFLDENIKYFPQNANMIQFLALSHYYSGDTDSAIKFLEYLVANSPTENNKILLNMIKKGENLNDIFD